LASPVPHGAGLFFVARQAMAPALLTPLYRRYAVNWFNLSFIGWLIVIIALALVAYKFDVQPFWIGIGALLLLGVGIITSVKHSKPRI
jgi:hypothetical protein